MVGTRVCIWIKERRNGDPSETSTCGAYGAHGILLNHKFDSRRHWSNSSPRRMKERERERESVCIVTFTKKYSLGSYGQM